MQFGYSFAFDAPTLPDEICACPSLASFRKQLKTYLHQDIPTLVVTCPWHSLWCLAFPWILKLVDWFGSVAP